MKIEALKRKGFEKIGKWKKSSRYKNKFAYDIPKELINQRAIYLFLVSNKSRSKKDIKYIGVIASPRSTLISRFNLYRSFGVKSGSTNKRIGKLIIKELENNMNVDIYVLTEEKLNKRIIKYCGVNIDLVVGLENNLIIKCQPEWNINNKKKI